jgi:hypothetical protein
MTTRLLYTRLSESANPAQQLTTRTGMSPPAAQASRCCCGRGSFVPDPPGAEDSSHGLATDSFAGNGWFFIISECPFLRNADTTAA